MDVVELFDGLDFENERVGDKKVEAISVRRLKQTWPESTMDLDGATDHGIRKFISDVISTLVISLR